MVMRSLVVLVPYPAQGHITPMLHLARSLREHGFEPIVVLSDFTYRRIVTSPSSSDGGVKFESIPSGLGDVGNDFFAIDGAMENYMPTHFERMLRGFELEGEVVCVVVDLLASWAIKVANRCGIRSAGFWPAMLATYRVISAIPELIREGFISECGIPLPELQSNGFNNHQHSCKDQEEDETPNSVLLPKLIISTKDLPWLVGNSASQKSRFKFWLRLLSRTKSLPWLLVNSFSFPQENTTITTTNGPEIIQIGSLLANNNNKDYLYSSMWEEDDTCMGWLDNQPPTSVTYVSFGSWASSSLVQPETIAELAHGLEATKRPFLWVLRDDSTTWRSALPQGFLLRVAGRGRIVGWAPQEEVLSHSSVGCYVTHCGWNSTMEAIRHEKRMLCYPLCGDQFLNCEYVVRVWRVGLRLDELKRVDVEEGIERVLIGREGEDMQRRVSELSEEVMGVEGSSRAEARLHSFMDAIRIRRMDI